MLRGLAKRLWRWPVAVGAVVFLVHLPYLVPGGPWARRTDALILGQDEGSVLYDSSRITDGQVMYRDFFMFQGPVFYHTNAALFAVTGKSILAARALHILTTALAAALLAVVVARFAGRKAGIAAAAVHAGVLVPMWPFAYPHWQAEVFALAALALLTDPGGFTRRRLLGAGALSGLCIFTIQSLGVPILVALAAGCAAPGLAARDWRRALRDPAFYLGGAAATAAAIVVYMAARGGLAGMWYGMHDYALHQYNLGQKEVKVYAWWTHEAMEMHRKQLQAPWSWLGVAGLAVAYALPFGAVLAAPLVAAVSLRDIVRRRDRALAPAVAGGAALAAVSMLFLAPIRPDLTHVAYLGGFGLVGLALLPTLVPRRAVAAAASVLIIGAGALSAATYAHKTVHTWSASRAKGTWHDEVRRLPSFRQIEKDAPPDATIVVGAMGGFYYLYLRPAAIPHTYMPATLSSMLTDAQWRRIGDAIIARRPWAMMFVGKQWSEILKRHPELAKLYQSKSGLLMLASP